MFQKKNYKETDEKYPIVLLSHLPYPLYICSCYLSPSQSKADFFPPSCPATAKQRKITKKLLSGSGVWVATRQPGLRENYIIRRAGRDVVAVPRGGWGAQPLGGITVHGCGYIILHNVT